eukprot:44398_1
MSFVSFTTVCIMYFYLAIPIYESTSKTVQLTPNTVLSANDISVSLGPGATVLSDMWSIDVESQHETDLTLHLAPSWGFHPLYTSTIEIFINGSTSTNTYDVDGEILFLFNVDDQYFAQMISIDSKPLAYRECPTSNTPLITTNITALLHSNTPDRYHRFCNNTPDTSNVDNWALSNGFGYKTTAQWPMYMSVTNDPNSNSVDYSWGDISTRGVAVSSHYTSAFNTDQGVDIHISGENYGEDFIIFSIDIMYHFEGTDAPTYGTTNVQTESPTARPTTRSPTTSRPTTIAPTASTTVPPTTGSPTTIAPSTASTTIAPTTTTSTPAPTTTDTTLPIDPSRTTDALNPTTSPTVALPPLQITVPLPSLEMTAYTTMGNTRDDLKEALPSPLDILPERTWYIVIISASVCVCICCGVLFVGLRKIKTHERAVSPKDYKGIRTMHEECRDKDEVEVYVAKPEGPHHGYKSSDSKINDIYDHNRFHHSADFSNNLSSAVTGDELLMEEIHHHMETDGLPHSHTSDDDVLAMSTETDSMMRTMATTDNHVKKNTFSSLQDIDEAGQSNGTWQDGPPFKPKYEYDGQYEYGVNKHDYHASHTKEPSSSSEELEEVINEDIYGNTSGQYAKYEIGMVTMSKISEMAPQSRTSIHRKEMEKMTQKTNITEGDECNEEYDAMSSDELLQMETAGFIDGDYNELEYEDEYYEDDDYME